MEARSGGDDVSSRLAPSFLSVSQWTNRTALDLRQANARLTADLVQVAPAGVDDILIMPLLSKLPLHQDAPAARCSKTPGGAGAFQPLADHVWSPCKTRSGMSVPPEAWFETGPKHVNGKDTSTRHTARYCRIENRERLVDQFMQKR